MCHNKRNGGKLHGNISRNGYGNAIIGRYGGCFEEGVWWVGLNWTKSSWDVIELNVC